MAAAKNVIVIICDDLCWGDLGAHGNPVVNTPNLDRLHGESARLTRYRSGPLCSPARASLLTGRYHPRTKVIDTYCGRSIIDPDEVSLAEHLRARGFATGCFGKWHLGDCHPSRPQDLGFDRTLVHLAGGIGQPGDHPANHAREHEAYWDPVLFADGEPLLTSGYCTDVFTDATIDFITNHADQRFFAYLAFNAPHTPLLVDREWSDPYLAKGACETHAKLYGMVTNLDHNLGRLLAHLEQLKLSDETLVVFTSDHGPCGGATDPDKGDRWNDDLRGIKGSLYEGGVRVPSLWRLPGETAAGCDVSRQSHAIDVTPSVCAALDIDEPNRHPIDGWDLWPLLTGADQVAWPERQVCFQWHRGNSMERGRNAAVTGDRWKAITPEGSNAWQLYDLVADPSETTDLANQYLRELNELTEAYHRWYDDVSGCKGPTTLDPPRIVIGTDRELWTLLTENDRRLISGEGWRRDDLRGFWRLAAPAGGSFRVTAHFRDHVPAGPVSLRIGDEVVVATRGASDANRVDLGMVAMPLGEFAIECWRDCGPGGFQGGYANRFASALYLELDREKGSSSRRMAVVV